MLLSYKGCSEKGEITHEFAAIVAMGTLDVNKAATKRVMLRYVDT